MVETWFATVFGLRPSWRAISGLDRPLASSSRISGSRSLVRPDGVRLLTARSGEDALQLLEECAASVGVIISDYAMPGMNGAELLYAVRLRWPDITRVLLTGNADLPAGARAVNEGQVARLYTKPWRPDEFRQAVAQALEQYRILAENRRLRALADEQAARLEQWNQHLQRQVAERTAELEQANARLRRGLLETVRLLVTSLEQRLPQRAAECREVARLAGRLAERAGMTPDEARWVQVAALVHDVGLTGLPDAILRRSPGELSMAASAQYQRHAVLGQHMLSVVPDLADMARWIRHHHERWDGRGYPDRLVGEAIPLPARIIALADGHLHATAFEGGTAAQWRRAQATAGAYDPELLRLLDDELRGRPLLGSGAGDAVGVPVERLRPGMVLEDEVKSSSGAVLLRAGERLTADHVQRLQQFLKGGRATDAARRGGWCGRGDPGSRPGSARLMAEDEVGVQLSRRATPTPRVLVVDDEPDVLAALSRLLRTSETAVRTAHDGHLGLLVLAEGVEDRHTWECLARLGCDLAQGYYLGRPAPPEHIAHTLRSARRPGALAA